MWIVFFFPWNFDYILLALTLSPFCQLFSPLPLQLGSRLKWMIFKEVPGSRNPPRVVPGVPISGSYIACPFPKMRNRQTTKAWLSGCSSIQPQVWPCSRFMFWGMQESQLALVELCPRLRIEVLLFWPQVEKRSKQKVGYRNKLEELEVGIISPIRNILPKFGL